MGRNAKAFNLCVIIIDVFAKTSLKKRILFKDEGDEQLFVALKSLKYHLWNFFHIEHILPNSCFASCVAIIDVVGKTSVIEYLHFDGGCQEQLFTAPRILPYLDTSSTRHAYFPIWYRSFSSRVAI